MHSAIRVEQLSKTFTIQQSHSGIFKTLTSLFNFKRDECQVIHNLSFQIQTGERIAFIGPNGAGKSTTIKMLTGILYPTSGTVDVLGCTPWLDRRVLGFKIGTVFGQRSQLWYHLPASDTFDLLSKIYELDPLFYKKRLRELIQSFELEPLLKRPVRQLSLGERMRCEIVASLLHSPEILFLDEPTIGLDINAKLIIRDLLTKLSKENGTTLFLTSHDTADIEQVSDRVIILDQGSIIMDSSIRELKRTYVKKKKLTLVTDQDSLTLNLPGVQVLETARHSLICEIDLSIIAMERVIQEAFKMTSVKDVTIEDPSMEEIIREVYAKKSRS